MADESNRSDDDLKPDSLNEIDGAGDEGDELMIEEQAESELQAEQQKQAAALEEAAKQIELVVLPLACTNEGKGAPLGMGIQRWCAQELTRTGVKAAAPVFTAMAEQDGRKVPALMIYRDEWTDERIIEGLSRFPNAKRALVTELSVDEQNIKTKAQLIECEGEGENTKVNKLETWEFEGEANKLPEKLFAFCQELVAKNGKEMPAKTWQENFGTEKEQAMLSFLVGLGNLSALQGRCVPASSDQLLNPLMDAINRDPGMDPAMEAIHAMVDILLGAQPDRAAVPLSVQALTIAAQKREKDLDAWHHLALVARRLGDQPMALNAFNQAFNLDPKNVPVAVNFIQTLRRAGDHDNALKVAKFSAEQGNENPNVLALLGAELIEADDFETAEPFLRRAVDEGQVPSAYGDLANVLWERASEEENAEDGKEDREEAMSLLKKAIDLKVVAKSTLDLLLDLYEEDSIEEAGQLILKAAETHKESSAALMAAASMYLEGDDPEKARPYLTGMLELKRRSLDDDAFARRGMLCLDIENFEERYEQAIEHIHSDSDKTADAAKFMREIIAKDQRFWQPHLMLALAVRSTEGDSSALGHLMNAAQLRPNDAEIRDLIAAILRKQGQSREAVDHLRVVVSLKPREIQPVINLATCMRNANMFDECRQVCEAALGMVPNHPEFKGILEALPPPKDQQN